MHAYITLSLLAGIRTEEARALRWQHLDLDGDLHADPPVPPHPRPAPAGRGVALSI